MGAGAGVLAALALAVGAPHGQGANLTAYTPNAYSEPAAVQSLDEMRDTGLRRAAVVVTWHMTDSQSSTVERDPMRTPTDASIAALAAAARERGISLLIKPQIDVDDETFRGDIQPRDRATWWESYGAMIDHYAALASRVGADGLAVGVELRSMSADTLAFEQLIGHARQRFSGTLVYSANWDEVEQVGFWTSLDAIGVDAYYPLTTHTGTSVDGLAAAWEPIADRLRQLSDDVDRPVIFTELGYAARPDAAVDPSGAYRSDGPVDVDAQARAYEAALRALGGEHWLRGIYWWDWPIDPRDETGDAYSPLDRPAQGVIRRAALAADGSRDGLGRFDEAASGSVLGPLAALPWPLLAIIPIWVAVAVSFLALIRTRSRGRGSEPTPAPPEPSPPPPGPTALATAPASAPTADEDAPTSAVPAAHASPIAERGHGAAAVEPADPLRDLGGGELDRLAAIIASVMAVDLAVVLVRAPDDPDTLISVGECGVRLRGGRWPTDSGLTARVLARGERVAVDDYAELDQRINDHQMQDVHCAASAPLVTRTGLRGSVSVASRDPARRMKTVDLELLSTLTELVAAAMDHPAQMTWPDEDARNQVEGLVSAMDARDRDERRRTTTLVAMADRVGARLLADDPRARAELTFAARLHDVGMLRVPVTPLQRPVPLADGVERLVTAHPAWGADLVSAIPGLQAVAAYVRFHQERWDGAGYPHGLAGERIPLPSRIISACEAWAAMVIGRPHAPARSPEHAVEELRRGAGTQFDPAVVEVIVSVSPTMPRPLPRASSADEGGPRTATGRAKSGR